MTSGHVPVLWITGPRGVGKSTVSWQIFTELATGTILLICGHRGVGKSTIGFHLYLRYLREGFTAGYVDLDQIAFVRPGPDDYSDHHRLKAAKLAAMWRTYQAARATHLMATGLAAGKDR